MEDTRMNAFQKSIRHGDRVTILIPCGLGRNGQEYKSKTGRAVMLSSHGGWVLNMGGKHGTPGLADGTNTLKVNGKRVGIGLLADRFCSII
jgi:hypothetical protein